MLSLPRQCLEAFLYARVCRVHDVHLDVVDGVVRHHLAFVDDDDLRAHRLHLLHDVRREKHGLLFPYLCYKAPYLDELVGVEAGGGLVKDENRWVMHHGLG